MTSSEALVPLADKATAEQIDEQLRGLVSTMGRNFLTFLALVERVLAERTYVALGYSKIDDYFEHVGMGWPTVRRYLPITEALRRLPEGEREEVRSKLGEIGRHKSIVLAPIIGEPNQPWQRLLDKAPLVVEADLQMEVSRLTGRMRQRDARAAVTARPSRSDNGQPSDPTVSSSEMSRWLKHTLVFVREDGVKAEIQNVFSAGRIVLDTDSDIAVLIAMCQDFKVDMETQALAKGWTPPVEESGEHVNEPTHG